MPAEENLSSNRVSLYSNLASAFSYDGLVSVLVGNLPQQRRWIVHKFGSAGEHFGGVLPNCEIFTLHLRRFAL